MTLIPCIQYVFVNILLHRHKDCACTKGAQGINMLKNIVFRISLRKMKTGNKL